MFDRYESTQPMEDVDPDDLLSDVEVAPAEEEDYEDDDED